MDLLEYIYTPIVKIVLGGAANLTISASLFLVFWILVKILEKWFNSSWLKILGSFVLGLIALYTAFDMGFWVPYDMIYHYGISGLFSFLIVGGIISGTFFIAMIIPFLMCFMSYILHEKTGTVFSGLGMIGYYCLYCFSTIYTMITY